MRDYRCHRCGRYFFAADIPAGHLRIVCRRCKVQQTITFSPPTSASVPERNTRSEERPRQLA